MIIEGTTIGVNKGDARSLDYALLKYMEYGDLEQSMGTYLWPWSWRQVEWSRSKSFILNPQTPKPPKPSKPQTP